MRKSGIAAARSRVLAACLLVSLLAACNTLKHPPSTPDAGTTRPPVTGSPPERRGEVGPLPVDDNQAVSMLLGYAQRLRALGLEDMRREYALANQAYNKSRADENRLRLGIVLAAPNAAVRDDARAISLFEGAVPDRRGGALGQFASLMQGMLTERSKQVHEEQRRADGLQQKLDALKAIEQSMSERDARGPAARPRDAGK